MSMRVIFAAALVHSVYGAAILTYQEALSLAQQVLNAVIFPRAFEFAMHRFRALPKNVNDENVLSVSTQNVNIYITLSIRFSLLHSVYVGSSRSKGPRSISAGT